MPSKNTKNNSNNNYNNKKKNDKPISKQTYGQNRDQTDSYDHRKQSTISSVSSSLTGKSKTYSNLSLINQRRNPHPSDQRGLTNDIPEDEELEELQEEESHFIEPLFQIALHIVQSSLPKTGPVQPTYNDKLLLYSLFKQASHGDAKSSSISRPGVFDMLGRAKWDAWKAREGLSSIEAKKLYIESVLKILRSHRDRPEAKILIESLASYEEYAAAVDDLTESDEDLDFEGHHPSSPSKQEKVFPPNKKKVHKREEEVRNEEDAEEEGQEEEDEAGTEDYLDDDDEDEEEEDEDEREEEKYDDGSEDKEQENRSKTASDGEPSDEDLQSSRLGPYKSPSQLPDPVQSLNNHILPPESPGTSPNTQSQSFSSPRTRLTSNEDGVTQPASSELETKDPAESSEPKFTRQQVEQLIYGTPQAHGLSPQALFASFKNRTGQSSNFAARLPDDPSCLASLSIVLHSSLQKLNETVDQLQTLVSRLECHLQPSPPHPYPPKTEAESCEGTKDPHSSPLPISKFHSLWSASHLRSLFLHVWFRRLLLDLSILFALVKVVKLFRKRKTRLFPVR